MRNEFLIEQMAAKLKKLRTSLHIKQEDVRYSDDACEINIGRIESGKHEVTISTLAYLCERYQTSLSDFFIDIKTQP